MLDRYVVDLRSFSFEEQDRYSTMLDNAGFLCDEIKDKPGLYEVFWEKNNPYKIERVLPIPSNLITLTTK